MSETWTAVRKEETEQGTLIIFKVEDKSTDKVREEERYENALSLMFALGGYPSTITMLMMPLPWSFHKNGDYIFIPRPDTDTEKQQQ